MKFPLAVALITVIAASAAFGFLLIGCDSHGCGREQMKCFAERMQGVSCPESAGPFVIANFHLGALKIFTTATLGDSAAFASVTIFLLALAAISPAARVAPVVSVFTPTGQRTTAYASVPVRRDGKFNHWLALHEGRDPRTPSWVHGGMIGRVRVPVIA